MSRRASEIAQVLMEEWFPEKETATDFLERKFPNDTTANLTAGVDLMEEIVKADGAFTALMANHQ